MMSLTLSLHVGAHISLSTGEPLWGRVITYSVESALKMGLRLAAQYNGWQVYKEVVDFEFASCCRSPRILFAVASEASYM